jgi:hypothetical protein
MILNQRKNLLRFIGLLLTYLIGIAPSFLWHEHSIKITSFREASPCEKVIYYPVGKVCEHQTHITETIEKCGFCDHHTPTPLAAKSMQIELLIGLIHQEYLEIQSSYLFQPSLSLFNKGPPSLHKTTA